MEYAFAAIVLVGVAGLTWWQLTTRGRVFVIRIRNGVPVPARGKVSPAFVTDLADVLGRHGIRHGAIYGVKRRGMVSLAFSRSIPNGSRQALRNVWSMHGR